MTLNYNHALFRQLRPTMVATLRRVAHDARDIEVGQADGAQWASLGEMRDMAGNLAMMGCVAMERLSRTLVLAIERVQDAPAQGWTETRTRQVAQAIGALALAVLPQVERLAEHETVFPVRMFPQWRQLLEQLNEPVPSAESLYEPDPEFGELTFSRMDPDYLAKVVRPAEVRLTQAIQALAEATEAQEVGAALGQAGEVFQWATNLHHRRTFHAYWLVVRARLAQGELDPVEGLRHREAFQELLRDARVELKRFGADAKGVTHGRILHGITPLLARWPAHWQHPALAELRQVFALDAFWEALDDLQADPDHPSVGQQFDQRREEITQAVTQVREAWEKWLVGTTQPSDVLRRLAQLVPLAPLFPQEDAALLVDRLERVLTWSLDTPDSAPEDVVIQEIAASLLALDDALDPRQQGQAELREQLKLQNLRLDALMVPGRPSLDRLPVIRWGNARRRRETQEARRHSLQQIANDLGEVELRMDEILREEIEPKDVRQVLTDLVGKLAVGTAALEMLRLPLHARIQSALLDHLDAIAGRPALLEDPAEHQRLALVVPALSRAVLAEAEGQLDTEEMLAGVAATFLNEPLQGRTDAPALPGEGESVSPVFVVPDAVEPMVDSAEAEDALAPSAIEVALAPDETPLSAPPSPAETFDHELVLDLDEPEPVDALELDLDEPAPVVVAPLEVGEALRSAQGYTEDRATADAELVDIYFAEVLERVSEIRLARDVLSTDHQNQDALDTLRRAFHSIKGSGRLVGLQGLGELGFWGESYIRGLQARNEAFLAAQDSAVAMLAQTLVLTIEDLQETASTPLYGRVLWEMLYPETASSPSPAVGAGVLAPEAAETPAEEPVFDLHPWAESTPTDQQDAAFDTYTGTVPEAARVPLDYDPVPVEPVSPPLSATETYWRSPEADADAQGYHPADLSDEPEQAPARSALQSFLDDPESRDALTSEWQQRTEQLQAVLESGNAQDLELIAHTLRTLALMFEWHEWADEFAEVENLAGSDMDAEEVRGWAVRWLSVIAQAQAGLTPAWSDEPAAVIEPSPAVEDMLPSSPDDAAVEPTVAAVIEPSPVVEEAPQAPADDAPLEPNEAEVPAEVDPTPKQEEAPETDTSVLSPVASAETSVDAARDSLVQLPADATEAAIWDEVFAAFGQLMEGGRQLGAALERLAQHRNGA